MEDSFEIIEYLAFLRARWKFVALACFFALVAGTACSLVLPKRYTATATILIDPPVDGDPRMATAVSTEYLESLKTYELLATDDQLFEQAATQFHLRNRDSAPIESLKRRVLKVEKLRDTRALQISVTLGDARTAQAMAQFIAEGAVALNRSGSKEAENVMIQEAAKAADTAKGRFKEAEAAWQNTAGEFSEGALQEEVSDDSALKSRVEEQLVDEQGNLAELENKERRLTAARAQASDGADEEGEMRAEIDASHARIELLERRSRELTRLISEKSTALARQTAREQDLESALSGARASYETAAQRLSDLPVTLGSRSEWLRVVDPGIVPQRPSSPNVAVILIGTLMLAFSSSLLYLTLSFSLGQARRRYHPPLRMAIHGDD